MNTLLTYLHSELWACGVARSEYDVESGNNRTFGYELIFFSNVLNVKYNVDPFCISCYNLDIVYEIGDPEFDPDDVIFGLALIDMFYQYARNTTGAYFWEHSKGEKNGIRKT